MTDLQKLAIYEDLATGNHIERYKFDREDGKTGTLFIEPSKSCKMATMIGELRDKNADPSLCTKEKILDAVAAPPSMRYAYAAMTGWNSSGKGFVLPHRLIGTDKDRIKGVSPDRRVFDYAAFRSQGSSQQWLSTVAAAASSSSAAMFTISTAFAAPLLKMAAEEPFCVCLFGVTRSGKTLATLAASSVGSVGKADELLSWNSTIAGLESAFLSHNDSLLIIDDLNKLRADTESVKYAQIRNVAYTLLTGSDRRRHQGYVAGRQTGGQYRLISMTSSEEAIHKLASRIGVQRGGGAVRLIDVPACYNNLSHIFDLASSSDKIKPRSLQRRFDQLIDGCANNHGFIFRKYIMYLIANRKKSARDLKKFRDQFVVHVHKEDDTSQIADLARKFGLIYAGGAIAIEAVDLPWTADQLLNAVARCYSGAADEVHTERRLLRDGRKNLKTYLLRLPKMKSGLQWEVIEGYACVDSGQREYVVRVENFNRVFENERQRQLVLEWLVAKSNIVMANPKGSKQRLPQEQFLWPDKARRRSYKIDGPDPGSAN